MIINDCNSVEVYRYTHFPSPENNVITLKNVVYNICDNIEIPYSLSPPVNGTAVLTSNYFMKSRLIYTGKEKFIIGNISNDSSFIINNGLIIESLNNNEDTSLFELNSNGNANLLLDKLKINNFNSLGLIHNISCKLYDNEFSGLESGFCFDSCNIIALNNLYKKLGDKIIGSCIYNLLGKSLYIDISDIALLNNSKYFINRSNFADYFIFKNNKIFPSGNFFTKESYPLENIILKDNYNIIDSDPNIFLYFKNNKVPNSIKCTNMDFLLKVFNYESSNNIDGFKVVLIDNKIFIKYTNNIPIQCNLNVAMTLKTNSSYNLEASFKIFKTASKFFQGKVYKEKLLRQDTIMQKRDRVLIKSVSMDKFFDGVSYVSENYSDGLIFSLDEEGKFKIKLDEEDTIEYARCVELENILNVKIKPDVTKNVSSCIPIYLKEGDFITLPCINIENVEGDVIVKDFSFFIK